MAAILDKMPDLVDKKIVSVSPLRPEELAREGWDEDGLVDAIVLDDGTLLYSSNDDSGDLLGQTAEGELFIVRARQGGG